ncbi:ferrous iron transport protein A [Methanogenium sp. S4BF]|uniref:FeoA family protein n=1 Tax=Methanogenium sp. S4BF TaxID=1789226 RepID=UPI002415B8A5|nr:FeoA family protein [Methanogenium sp. S4BF]WFN33957.1 ferrous iron transport protein A [Methanogenium sp. S4BF]
MLIKLSDLPFGETAVVREIHTPAHDLNCMGLRIGRELKMITRQPIKGPVVVSIGELEIAMGLETAARIVAETGTDV